MWCGRELRGPITNIGAAHSDRQSQDIQHREITIMQGSISMSGRIISREVKNGTPEDDFYLGTGGRDTYHGLGGNDTIFGDDRNDRLYGDGGDDSIYGDFGNDLLFGGKGDDLLAGCEGRDVLNGGRGADQFFFWDMYQQDTIADFQFGIDEINIGGLSGVSSFRDLKKNHMANVGSNVVITGEGGDQLTILNAQKSDFDIEDFQWQT
jgi:serralysin